MNQAMQIPETRQPLSREINNHNGDDRGLTALQLATDKYHKATDWVAFFRETLGVDGIVPKLFPIPEELDAFERTAEYSQIQVMIAKLRERKDSSLTEDTEPIRVITVRLPKSVHESLKKEAHNRQTSMNQLCISKLLQMIDNGLVPSD